MREKIALLKKWFCQRMRIIGFWLIKRYSNEHELFAFADKIMRSRAAAMPKETQEKFEQAFGRDSKTRTPEQWKNLVRHYGPDTVMGLEKISGDELRLKQMTFSEATKERQRMARKKRNVGNVICLSSATNLCGK